MDHLQTTKCCDHTFTFQDLKGRVMGQLEALGTNDPKLYGGNAKRFGRAECPNCGKSYIMWLKPKSPSYKVLTISQAPIEIEKKSKTKLS